MSDQHLLRDYAERRSDAAFAELVRRHVDLVFSAARRMTGEEQSARDATQAVFVALAQNAARLTQHPVLSGWLHCTARNLAAKSVRAEVRRRAREQEAAAMNQLLSDSGTGVPPVWADIAPHLDAALGELNDAERDALLLRYFEKKSAPEMAGILGISDDAAQKRVSRAVERLREFFAKHGIIVGASGLVVLISANAVQAAPLGLAVTISAAAALAGTTLATSATATATKAIAMTTLQKTLVTATVAVLAGAGIYEARQAAQLRDRVQTLQQQQAPLAEQIQQLARERDDATRQLAALREDNERLNRNTGELLRLRSEATSRRRDTTQLDDPSTQAALAWVAKKGKLQKLFDEKPDQRIPEMRFLTDKKWLDLAKDLDLDSEDGRRFATHHVRTTAKFASAPIIAFALKQYLEANNGAWPTEVSQLKTFMDQPIEDEVLQRYRIMDKGEAQSGWLKGMVLIEKVAADKWQETQVTIGPTNWGLGPTPEPVRLAFPEVLKPAMEAYRFQNSRGVPKDFNELRPYVTTPEQGAALDKLIKALENK